MTTGNGVPAAGASRKAGGGRVGRSERCLMADEKKEAAGGSGGSGEESGTATAKPKGARKAAPKRKPPRHLPPWKVLLHNDDKNNVKEVVDTIVELTPLNKEEAVGRMKE